MATSPLPLRAAGLLAVAGCVWAPFALAAQAQDGSEALGPVDAMQIGELSSPAPRAFLDRVEPRSDDPADRPELEQVARIPEGPAQDRSDRQIPFSGERGLAVSQLSKTELDATLSQLTEAERRVLFEAIEGTDICDNPPDVAAIIALCRSRLESRSGEFTPSETRELTAEESLLNGQIDAGATASLERVIDRLSRTRVASDDFSNQAIASFALNPAQGSGPPAGEEEGDAGNLAPGTQELISAIINQLSGSGGP